MKRQVRLVIGGFGLIAVVGLAIIAGSALRQPTTRADLIAPLNRQIIPREYGVYSVCTEIVQPSASPFAPIVVQDVYCNGDRGMRVLTRDRGLLIRKTVWFKDTDRKRFDAEYAADGMQVVSGFELRDDGTKQWQAAPDGNGLVTTTKYWWDGNLYSVERRKVGEWMSDTTFYYDNGQRRAHLIGNGEIPFVWATRMTTTVYDSDNKLNSFFLGLYDVTLPTELGEKPLLVKAETWAENGLQTAGVEQKDGQRIFTMFKPDGTRGYEQVYKLTESSDEGGRSVKFTFDHISVYSAEGTRIARVIKAQYYWFDMVVDFDADGSRTEHEITSNRIIVRSTRFDKSGKELWKKEPANKSKPTIELDQKMFSEQIMSDPTGDWKKAEEAHFQRTIIE